METLPNELLLEILRYSNYWDLKLRLSLVCRRLRELISTKSGFSHVDRLLFRDFLKTSNTLAGKQAGTAEIYELHPIFRPRWLCFDSGNGGSKEGLQMYIVRTTNAEACPPTSKRPIGDDLLSGQVRLADTCVMEENVLSPSVKRLTVRVGELPYFCPRVNIIAADESKGVTVRETVDAVFTTLKWQNSEATALHLLRKDYSFRWPVVTMEVVDEEPRLQISFAMSLRPVM